MQGADHGAGRRVLQMRLRCWSALLWLCVLIALSGQAQAHDLAIDQVLLSPDAESGALRGQIVFDPELTRSKDAQPTDEHARRVIEFLKANLALEVDQRRVPLRFAIRELWDVGGATPGDVVNFTTPLAASAREVRLHAKGFKALVVSVQRVRGAEIETTSWLLGKDESTPVYRMAGGWQQAGWRAGGPDVFSNAIGRSNPSAAETPGVEPPIDRSRSELSAGSSAPVGANAEASSAGLAVRFIRLGFEHIVPAGLDHMLFVAGLVLARARRYRQVLISLSLFTLAHTLTLALGNFQLVQVSPRVVEPLIAFSIFLLGVDNLRASRTAPAPAPVRYLLVFGFGLVHGLGFASALSELTFDPNQIVLALFSFNLGVELGQIAVVVLLGSLMIAIQRWHKLERVATLAGSAAIAVIGLVMVVERVSPTVAEAARLSSISEVQPVPSNDPLNHGS